MFRQQCDGYYVYGSYQPFQFYASIVTAAVQRVIDRCIRRCPVNIRNRQMG